MSLKVKVIGLVVLLLGLLVGGLSIYTNVLVTNLVTDNAKKTYEEQAVSIVEAIETKLTGTEVAVNSVAMNEEVKKAFAERDRQGLQTMLQGSYEAIKDQVAQFQFHLPDSTSFLRLHQPEKFGDDLSSFRFTVNKANEDKETVRGIEEGVGGYGFRVVVPVSYQGRHLGTVEYGGNFDQVFLSELHDISPGDYYIYSFTRTEEGFVAANKETDPYILEAELIARAKEGQVVVTTALSDTYDVLLTPFTDYEGNYVGYIKYAQDRSGTLASIQALNQGILLFSGMAILVVAVLVFLVISRSLGGLKKLQEYAKVVGEGDLTVASTIKSKDEIGHIAGSFTAMRESLREVIGEIQSTISEVKGSSETITSTVEEVNASSEEIARAVDEIAEGATAQVTDANKGLDTTKNLAGRIIHIVELSETSKAQSEVMLEKTSQGIDALTSLQQNFVQNAASAKNVTEGIHELTKKSNSIGEIVGTINTIASQTNLLALNAAIEAARAGEHGRGFAVVAEEVRKLAEESSQASEEIRKIIGEIILVIGTTETAMKDTNEVLGVTSDSLKDTVHSYETIREEVARVMENIEKTNASVLQMDVDKNHVLEAIENISNVSEESAASTEEISATVSEQATAINEVVKSIESLNEVIKVLSEKIERFKI